MQSVRRWLGENLSSLILAFVLAVAVWVSAVISADPNEERTLRPIEIEVIGQPADLVIVNSIPTQARLTLKAPKSIWSQLTNNPDLAHAWIDLTGLGEGSHLVPVITSVDIQHYQEVTVDPNKIQVSLERLLKRSIPIRLMVTGDLPLGYRTGDPTIEPESVMISGPASAVNRVEIARAELNVSGSIETIKKSIPIAFLDHEGNEVTGITPSTQQVSVVQPISLLGRFKNVAVKVVTAGQVANGYRLTNISVAPPTFAVFSEDPELINEMPGYVETMPVDLTGLTDDEAVSIDLNLPAGITTVREPKVMVQVSVAAIEGSMTISLPLEVIGLSGDLSALLSPGSVDVIIAGPLNVLDRITVDDFQIVLDLTGLPPGVYQRTPVVELAPELVRIQTTLPETVEVTIELAATPTATPTNLTPPATGTPPAAVTPSPLRTPIPTRTSSASLTPSRKPGS